MTQTSAQTTEYDAIKVLIHNKNLNVHETAAEHGNYVTFNLTGSENPMRLLPGDPQRARAYITVSGTGPVWIGSLQQCQNIKAGASQGSGMVSAGLIVTGITVPVTHQQEIWLVGDGSHSAAITVSVERWS